MADTNILQSINIGGKRFSVPACWEELGLTKAYMLALLSRDEYTPTLKFKPDETTTIYTDPDSGNPAGFHEGQCVVYPDVEAPDCIGMSVAKQVTVNEQGVPTNIVWLHLGDIDKHSKWINDIADRRFTELSEGVGSLLSDVGALKTKSTTTDNNLSALEEQLNSLKASHNTLAPFVSKNQADIAKLTPTVEALESGGVYVAYWPSLTTEQYCAVPLEEWLEIKKENDEAVALGILVMPDMGEPFIVSLTEGKTKWHSSVSSVLYADGASTELTKHFNNTINVKERHIALYGNSCVLATYCIDHHYTINGAGYGPIQWYAPDLKMMMAMRKYFSQINKCLSAIDGAELLCSNGATYWTANEVSASKAVSINMSTSRIISGSKVVSACIRPVGFLAF